MTCEHLVALEQAIAAAGHRETFRGAPWSQNCREWVYYDCILDLAAMRGKFTLAVCVQDHQHLGTHDGSESGLVCAEHHDALMGLHPNAAGGARRFP